MTDKEIEKARHQLIVKSNDLIRQPAFTLSITEQRIILYLISKIKPEDEDFTEYDFRIKDFIQVCGINSKNYYAYLRDNIRNLAQKSIWIKTANDEESLVRWIEKAKINYGTGIIKIRIDEDLRPLLLDLKKNFTGYQLIAILALKNKYAIRIYELLKSYEYLGEYRTSIDNLRKLLMCEKEYPLTNDFKRYVIDKAIKEINTFTELEIEYSLEREGNTIKYISFQIKKDEYFDGEYSATNLYLKGKIPSRSQMDREIQAIIDDNQMTLFEEDLIEDIGAGDND